MKDTQTLRTQYRVSDFVEWARAGTLDLNPNFQRRPVWKKGAKSYLIDTILRGLPVPIIFLRDLRADVKTLKGKREVVDGQQRIRTILSFIEPKLVKNYKAEHDEFTIDPIHNSELGDMSFRQLPAEEKQQIMDYQFSVHSFAAETDDREILQIFARMNATGVKLNSQELRNAEFFGRYKTLAYTLATEQLNRWRDWKVFTVDQIARMLEVELTSELMLLIMDGVLEKNQATIDWYYDTYDKDFPDAKEVARRFRATMDSVEELFYDDDDNIPLFKNKTIFYALFAAVYGLHYELRNDTTESHKDLQRNKNKGTIRTSTVAHIVKAAAEIKSGDVPQNVAKASRGATAHAAQRRTIIGYLAGPDHDPCRHLR